MAVGIAKIDGLSDWMRSRVRMLIRLLEAAGFVVTVYSGRRTLDEQKALLAKGDTHTLDSKHLTGDAVDLIIAPEFGYKYAGMIWTSFGGKWGGDFKPPELAKAEIQHYEKGLAAA